MKTRLLFFRLMLLVVPAQAQPFTRDTSFNLNFNFFGLSSAGRIAGVIHNPANKLLVYGNFEGTPDIYRAGMVQFFPNGTIDPSFQITPSTLDTEMTSFVVPTNYGYWVRYNSSAYLTLTSQGQQIDPSYSFNIGSYIVACENFKPIIFNDGSLLIGGDFCAYPPHNPTTWLSPLKRILADGRLDTTFQYHTNEMIGQLLRYDSSRILMGGWFTEYDSIPITRICRIDTLGNLDTSFHSIFTSGTPLPVHVQDDGKIIIIGKFNIQGHSAPLGMVRLHPDGSLDSTFNNFNNVDVLADLYIGTVCPTSDGGYLIGGGFLEYQGVPRGKMVKTDANGYIEAQYLTGAGIAIFPDPNLSSYSYVNEISQGPNDQYYIAGYFNGFNGDTVQPVIRLNGPLTVGIEPAMPKKAVVAAYPNPARDYTTLSWELALPEGEATLIITDVTGREVQKHTIAAKQGQWVWNTRNAKAGMYFYSITQNGEQLTCGKIAVAK